MEVAVGWAVLVCCAHLGGFVHCGSCLHVGCDQYNMAAAIQLVCAYQGPSSLNAQPPLHSHIPPKITGRFSLGI